MKFGVPWSVKGIRPEARETAKEAARRSGLSLGDWLNTVILQQAAQAGLSGPQPHAHYDEQSYGQELSGVHQRLDELTRRLEYFTRTGPAAYAPRRQREENQTAALIGRLDQRLDQLVGQGRPMAPPLAPAMPGQPMQPASPAMPPRPHVPMPPALDRALAEIAARQRTLNGEPARAPAPAWQQPARTAPATPLAAVPMQDITGLERQLRKITDQIETLRKPGVEEAINALRGELGDIGRSLNDAMPKRAIDTIEKQIAGLTQRIAEGRQAGVDAGALAGIEHGLMEVRDALRGLTPAEQLVGFNEAVAGLAQKIDLIVAQRDPATLQQLENAITTLRSMASNVASNEAVSSLAAEVQNLTHKVDHIGRGPVGDVLSSLENRIDALSQALAERAQAGNTVPPRLEALVQSLADKIEQIQQIQPSRDDNVAVNHLEDRIVTLVERLDASDTRLGHLEAIERGLADLLVHMEEMRTAKHEAQNGASPALDAFKQDIARNQDALKQDMARTQGALDAVHGTLGLVVDRLAMIEKDIRSERRAAPSAAPAPVAESQPFELTQPVGKLAVRLVSDSPEPDPTMPPPAAEPPKPGASALEQALAATQASQPAPQPAPQAASMPAPAAPRPMPAPAAPAAPEAAPKPSPQPAPASPPQAQPHPAPAAPAKPQRLPAAAQLPINPDLPPDQPLEPGSGPPQFRAHPAARIAASEAALGGARPAPLTGGGQSNFIAAARRAAKAALAEHVTGTPHADALEESDPPGALSLRAKMMKRVKSLLVAASIVAAVAGAVQMAGSMFGHGGGTTKTAQRLAPKPAKGPAMRKFAAAPDTSNLLSAPMTIAVPTHNQQPMARSAADLLSAPALYSPNDITGSIPPAADNKHLMPPPRPAIPSQDAERLPSTIGSQRLRQAALAGNAGAAYEVAVRYAEGRGVPADPREAARWYERAANKGLAAAQFRYASMLEKGVGVKRDLARARQLYLAAAEQGNAKAMHNLAVLYAEGIDGKPNYATAVIWFRKAAQHGVDDSQYNLGILYARGIGVPKNLVESYKWFALAAAHGDKESAKKRDEIASRLDAKELAAARRAVADFKVERQPNKATAVPAPPGGWDKANAASPEPISHRGQPISLGAFTIGKR